MDWTWEASRAKREGSDATRKRREREGGVELDLFFLLLSFLFFFPFYILGRDSLKEVCRLLLLLLFCLLRKLEPEWIRPPEPEVAETKGTAARTRRARTEEGVASMLG